MPHLHPLYTGSRSPVKALTTALTGVTIPCTLAEWMKDTRLSAARILTSSETYKLTACIKWKLAHRPDWHSVLREYLKVFLAKSQGLISYQIQLCPSFHKGEESVKQKWSKAVISVVCDVGHENGHLQYSVCVCVHVCVCVCVHVCVCCVRVCVCDCVHNMCVQEYMCMCTSVCTCIHVSVYVCVCVRVHAWCVGPGV